MTMTSKGRFGVAPERTVGQLVADASQDLSELVRYEIALAKAEITADVKKGAIGGALLAVAGVFGLLGFIFFLVFAAYLLMELAGWTGYAAYGLVFGVLLVLAGILAVVGIGSVKKVGPPTRTIRTSKETIATLKASVSHRN
ncbi:phage holin family protein [Kineococcus gynurae]|uniref:Phage holin family protein n=1 Tax=Kineococcus gynurae TaxID=452979 RepID=A0ABV5LU95_9ACTN